MKIDLMNDRIVLKADNGRIVTNGDDIYGKEIELAVGRSADGFYEITEEEYEATLPKVEEGSEWI